MGWVIILNTLYEKRQCVIPVILVILIQCVCVCVGGSTQLQNGQRSNAAYSSDTPHSPKVTQQTLFLSEDHGSTPLRLSNDRPRDP